MKKYLKKLSISVAIIVALFFSVPIIHADPAPETENSSSSVNSVSSESSSSEGSSVSSSVTESSPSSAESKPAESSTNKKPLKAGGMVIENVDQNGNPFVVPKNAQVQQRQFVSFVSASGQQYYLVIDYAKEGTPGGQNVHLLVEASEKDLIALAEETRSNNAPNTSVFEKKIIDRKNEFNDIDSKQSSEKQDNQVNEQSDSKNKANPDKESSDNKQNSKESGSFAFYIAIVILVALGAVGFTFFKRNKKNKYEAPDESDLEE